jgi:hypothetical protein
MRRRLLDDWATDQEIAEEISCHPRTVRRAHARGELVGAFLGRQLIINVPDPASDLKFTRFGLAPTPKCLRFLLLWRPLSPPKAIAMQWIAGNPDARMLPYQRNERT